MIAAQFSIAMIFGIRSCGAWFQNVPLSRSAPTYETREEDLRLVPSHEKKRQGTNPQSGRASRKGPTLFHIAQLLTLCEQPPHHIKLRFGLTHDLGGASPPIVCFQRHQLRSFRRHRSKKIEERLGKSLRTLDVPVHGSSRT